MRITTKSWLPLAIAMVLAAQAAPAGAVAPSGHSIAFTSVFGELMDCVEFRCGKRACWARAVYTGEWGKCTPIDQFEPGRTRLSCSYKNVDWSWPPYERTKEVVLDITCTRFGESLWFVGGKYSSGPPLSCAAAVTYRRAFGDETWSESYLGIVLDNRRRCRQVFGTLTPVEWGELRVWDYIP